MIEHFDADLQFALHNKISLNPILNAFQETDPKYNIVQASCGHFYEAYA